MTKEILTNLFKDFNTKSMLAVIDRYNELLAMNALQLQHIEIMNKSLNNL